MFTDAKSMMFYIYGLIDKFENKFYGQVTTVCPPTSNTTDEQSYNRAIHISLKFVYSILGNLNTHYVAFRFTFPRHLKPSEFSSIEVFDSSYTSVYKLKYADFNTHTSNALNFSSFISTFEEKFFNHILVDAVTQPPTVESAG